MVLPAQARLWWKPSPAPTPSTAAHGTTSATMRWMPIHTLPPSRPSSGKTSSGTPSADPSRFPACTTAASRRPFSSPPTSGVASPPAPPRRALSLLPRSAPASSRTPRRSRSVTRSGQPSWRPAGPPTAFPAPTPCLHRPERHRPAQCAQRSAKQPRQRAQLHQPAAANACAGQLQLPHRSLHHAQ